jgi:protein-S-isoprenylcysteine O-methyltransferase Ste14
MSALELKIPPVALVLLTAGLMGLGAWGLPRLTTGLPGRAIAAGGLAAAGAAVCILGVASFRRAKTTVNPMTPEATSALVIVGVYRWTRNPMYLGFLLILCGLAGYLSNALAAALLPVFIVYMTRFQIRPEERALEARFGADYVAYKVRVRRWI